MGPAVQDKPRKASCKVLTSTPDFIRSNWVGAAGGGVDTIAARNDLEEPLLNKLKDPVSQLDSRGLGIGIVLEPVDMEMKLLDLIVVIGLETGGSGGRGEGRVG